jgi:16S rRNA (cytidine1402-2'-O)-methyltransferase
MPKLFLIPNLIAEDHFEGQVTSDIVRAIETIDFYIVENIRTARRFMKRVSKEKDIDKVTFFELNKHNPIEAIPDFFKPFEDGHDMGLLSEAGVPCVADPGALVVDYAHSLGLEVVPLVGASSILLALMASGLNGQQFCFHGYLPIQKHERVKKIKQLDKTVSQGGQTQIFIETPYRNNAILGDLMQSCSDQTKLCIASEIMGKQSLIKTRNIASWKVNLPDLQKKTVVFLLGR